MGTHSHRCLGQILMMVSAIVLLASPALAQGIYSGTVTDDEGNPFEGATIVAERPEGNPSRFETATEADGKFQMIGMSSGEWAITVEYEGYHPLAFTVRITQGPNAPSRVGLERIKHPLEVALGEAALEGLDPEALGAELEAADEAYNSQQWEPAIAAYQSLLERVPMLNPLHMQIGSALTQLRRYDEAIVSFETALAGDPGLEDQVETEIARIRMSMGDFDAAGDALASAAGNAGATREDLYNLGELEFAKGEVDTAAEWYEKASAADPNWGKPIFKLALVALNKGDIETAKQFFAQVVEKDPNSEEGAQAQATLAALP